MTRPSADRRLQRLLVMVPWVAGNEGPTVEEVCSNFDMTESELVADLEMLFMCGLYPFTPDTLIEADIVDGRVWIRYADAFERPPTFTRQEAFTLVAAASAAVALPENLDNQPLRSAIAKLATTLGISDTDIVDVELANDRTDELAIARTCVDQHRVLETDYYSFGKDSWSRRQIEPYQVFNTDGQWYVQGRSIEHGKLRTFRVDRMRNLVATHERFRPPAKLPITGNFTASPDDPVVTIDLIEEGKWVAQQYPLVDRIPLPNGNLRVSLQVSEAAWLERLLLRLGSAAVVVDGGVDVKASARRLLGRYQ